jgi:hypothetical protein
MAEIAIMRNPIADIAIKPIEKAICRKVLSIESSFQGKFVIVEQESNEALQERGITLADA